MNRAWECRYFSAKLPRPFSHTELSPRFPWDKAARLHDVYILGDPGANLKLRRSLGTFKLKVLLKRRPDGFELWETVFDVPWPPSASAWRTAAKALGSSSLDDLDAARRPQDLVRLVRGRHPELRVVEVAKTRRFYRLGIAQLEVARVRSGTKTFHSIEFEATTLQDALAARRQFPTDRLGAPSNYVDAVPGRIDG